MYNVFLLPVFTATQRKGMCILCPALRIGRRIWQGGVLRCSALVVSNGSCAVRKHSMLESECVQWKRVEQERMRVQICSESSFLCFYFTVALAAVVALWKWWASRACSRLGRAGLLAHTRYRWCHHSGSTLVGKSLTTHCLAGASSSDMWRREEVWRSGSPSAPT